MTLSDFPNLTSLQVIAASARVEAYMETKAIRGVEQHLWLTYGSTESMFRLAEYSCHVLLVCTFCWLVADTIIVRCPHHCGDDCDGVGGAEGDTFDGVCVYSVAAAAAQPAQSVCVTVLGVLAMLSSLSSLVEELVEVLYTLRSIYGIDRGISITLHIHRTAVQANALLPFPRDIRHAPTCVDEAPLQGVASSPCDHAPTHPRRLYDEPYWTSHIFPPD
jgi:hypothetical protein